MNDQSVTDVKGFLSQMTLQIREMIQMRHRLIALSFYSQVIALLHLSLESFGR